jgi:pimeloyl-ACP methyl ester carboxylesterase
MNAIWRAFRAERLKLNRTLALRLILLAPMLVALLGLLIQSAAVTRDSGASTPIFWESHTRNSLTIWAVFLLPLLITVETALLCGIEHGERHWKHLFALPAPRYAIYCAKFAMAQSLTLLSTLLVSLLILLSGWLLMLLYPSLAAAGPPPLLLVLGEALACWLAAGLILSANLWVAIRWPSFTVPLGVGIGGTFFALFAASAEAAKYYPWLLPLDALSGGERLRIALILGIGGGLLVAVLGCVDFARREESAPPNLTRVGLGVWASILLGFVGLSGYLDRQIFSNREPPHTTQFVTVDENVKLEVLDWGGSGRPIVLLSGLGDTAHVFGKFAMALTGQFHVYGITRRGFGASSAPAFGYSADRLGEDVLAVLESLKLTKPVLVGHSIGGEELSSIGSRHPDRVAGLIYLDAAYSYAYYEPSRGDFNIDLFELDDKIERLKPGSGLRDPRPLLQDLVGSLSGFERVLKERLQELDALSVIQGATGPQLSTDEAKPAKPGVAAARAITAGERKYSRIPVPILAIFALPHEMGANNPYAAVAEASDIASITGPQARAFEIGVPSARVVRLPHASHYIFQSNQYDVVREITAFIRGLPQR